MQFFWRKQRPGEFDHEAVWGGLGLALLVLASFFPFDRFPLTVCWFHRLTGLPCPSCGGTRAFMALAHGRPAQSFLLNPLAAFAFLLLIVAIPYCSWVVLLRRRRLRIADVSERERVVLLAIPAIAIVANWVYLIIVGR